MRPILYPYNKYKNGYIPETVDYKFPKSYLLMPAYLQS